MENPYQSPEESSAPLPGRAPIELDRRPPGLVRHVRVVAILMVVQGALELLAALGLGFLAAVIRPLMAHQHMQPAAAPPEQVVWILTVLYGGAAVAALAAAVLHIAAGLRNYRFRGRTLGFVALGSGILTLLTCYCLPTAVGLSVYGLIVYLNDAVSDAFCMGESGWTANEILATFSPVRETNR